MSEQESDGEAVSIHAHADGLLAAMRSGFSADASPEARANAVAACRALLGAVEGGGSRAGLSALGSAAASHGTRGIPREQIIGLVAGLMRSVLGPRTPTYLTKPEPPATKSRGNNK